VKVSEQVVIITGAAQGIGRAYAERFAQEEARVVIIDKDKRLADATAAAIRSGGAIAEAICADVTSEDEMRSAVEHVIQQHGQVDTLINNAALYGDIDFNTTSISYLESVLRVNIVGVLISSRAVFPHMKRQHRGSIINIGSTGAYEFVNDLIIREEHDTIPSFHYPLSKAGVVSLTKFMAGSIGKYGIRVNCICPGLTLSEATLRKLSPELRSTFASYTAMQCSVRPEDLTGTALYLASDESRLVTGQIIMVDCGYIMAG
jgi:NAD(P)-dependent dehydrogenase (short-subunit alcohol dehydrogenase family)